MIKKRKWKREIVRKRKTSKTGIELHRGKENKLGRKQ
jgi:hypothetical protein